MSGQNRTFWMASGAVFLANALFSIVEGHWLPGVLQLVTAGTAGVAAICSRQLGRDPDGQL